MPWYVCISGVDSIFPCNSLIAQKIIRLNMCARVHPDGLFNENVRYVYVYCVYSYLVWLAGTVAMIIFLTNGALFS